MSTHAYIRHYFCITTMLPIPFHLYLNPSDIFTGHYLTVITNILSTIFYSMRPSKNHNLVSTYPASLYIQNKLDDIFVDMFVLGFRRVEDNVP